MDASATHLRVLLALLQPRSLETVSRTNQSSTHVGSSDGKFQRLDLPEMAFLPQQYVLQSGLVVNVRNVTKDDDRTALELFTASTERGEGYALYEFPNLELLRRDLVAGHWGMFEEVASGRVVGCCGVGVSRSDRTPLPAPNPNSS